MKARIAILVAFGLITAQARAQSGPSPYAPVTTTHEIVAVFVGMSDCCNSLTPSLRGPLDTVRLRLADQAAREHATFRMVGLSLDWSPEAGWNYLKQLGTFDEVAVGSNWFNLQSGR